MIESGAEAAAVAPTATATAATTPFDVAQRAKQPKGATWSTWAIRQFLFLGVKFVFLFAFYTLQFQSHQIESPPANPSLSVHLAEFRKDSRSSRHESVVLRKARVRSRQLAENNENENDADALLGTHDGTYMLWEPLDTQCTASDMIDTFPESFDPVFYQAQHHQDYEHYLAHGRNDGYNCTRGQYMRDILQPEIAALLPGKVLEIGPFINPMLRNIGNNQKIEYFDVDSYARLEAKAQSAGYMAAAEPIAITYVDPLGDLSVIPAETKYSMVVSSNVIGVQLNLAHHLQQVGNLLEEGGYYTLMVPDKRFSHDHFSKESGIADVLHDYFSKNEAKPTRKHKLRSFVESLALQVPNDAEKNWHGEYGYPYEDASDATFLSKLQSAISEFKAAKPATEYVDVLQYQFTPHSLAFVVDTLYSLGLIDLRVHRLYDTLADDDEFSIVLKKCTPV